MLRRLLRILAGAAFLLLLAAGSAVLFRLPLAEAIAESWLKAHGVPAPEVEITALGFESALASLRAGAAAELQAASIDLRYDLAKLRPATPLAALESVTMEGLILHLDLTGRGPPLGSLQGLLEGDEEPLARDGFALPPIRLRNARVEVATVRGPVAVSLDGNAGPAADNGLAASLRLHAESDEGSVSGSASMVAGSDGAANGSLVVDDGHLRASPEGAGISVALDDLNGAVAFTLQGWEPASLTGDLAASGRLHPAGGDGELSLSFDATAEEATAEAAFAAADGLLDARLTLDLADYRAAPRVRAELRANVGAGAAALRSLPLPPIVTGAASLDLQIAGRLPAFEPVSDAPPLLAPASWLRPIPPWLAEAELTTSARLSLDGLGLSGKASGLDALVAATAVLDRGTLRLALVEDARIAARSLDRGWLSANGLPAAAVELLRNGASLTLEAKSEPATRADIAPSQDGLSLHLAGVAELSLADSGALALSGNTRLALAPDFALSMIESAAFALSARNLTLAGQDISEAAANGTLSGSPDRLSGTAEITAAAGQVLAAGLRAVDAKLRLPIAFDYGVNGPVLSLTAPGHVGAARVALGEIALLDPAAALPQATVSFAPADGAVPEFLAYDLTLAPEAFRLTLPDADGGRPRRVELTLGEIALTSRPETGTTPGGRARLAASRATLAEPAVVIERLSGEADYDASFSQMTARFTAAVESRGEPAILAPLSVAGRLVRDGPDLRLTAEARHRAPEATELRLPFTAHYNLARRSGEVRLPVSLVRFTPDGLQPGDLIPALAGLANVSGEASIGAQLSLSPGGSTGAASLVLQDVAFRSGAGRIEALHLDLSLDKLRPLSSPPGQRLAIARIESVVPLEDVEARFQVVADDDPGLRIERLAFRLAGGTFQARDALIVAGAPRQELTFQVEGLDLATLLQSLAVEGLSGSGLLDGRIPLALEGRQIAVHGGHLEARGPGVLRYRSQALERKLPAETDELSLLENPVDLVILALEDFQYDKLSLDLDKAAGGETRILLHLEGKNPALLDGYPFVFNINLKGNLDPLITALQQGVRLSDEMIRRSWKLQP